MKLNEQVKQKIKEFNNTLDSNVELEDAVELTLDYLIDNDIVDLSDDEDGDMYEALSNDVWEFIEEELNKN
jgi:hypothetical protein